MSVGGRSPRTHSVQLLCDALAGPLFVTAFTEIGAGRQGYDLPSGGPDEKSRGQADAAPTRPTRAGQLHNLCGIPVFAGIPIAGLASAATAVRSRDYRWACYSAGSSTVMAGSFLFFGAAIRGRSRLRGKSGVFQRISIATGLGWLSSLSLRGLSR